MIPFSSHPLQHLFFVAFWWWPFCQCEVISHGRKEPDTTERLNWSELNWTSSYNIPGWLLESALLFSTRWHYSLSCQPSCSIFRHHSMFPRTCSPRYTGECTQRACSRDGSYGLRVDAHLGYQCSGREISGDGTLRGLWDVFLLSTMLLITFKFFSAFFPISSLPSVVELPLYYLRAWWKVNLSSHDCHSLNIFLLPQGVVTSIW